MAAEARLELAYSKVKAWWLYQFAYSAIYNGGATESRTRVSCLQGMHTSHYVIAPYKTRHTYKILALYPLSYPSDWPVI